ncbi:MAG: CBS domain-containing protein [Bacilli bacterium]|nr:CBS domain-containing protein [Bacilli bacterium]
MEKNVLSLLTLKKDVAYLQDDFTLRQAIEKMEAHSYSVIPVIDHESGKYLYSLSEGSILYYLKDRRIAWDDTNKIPLPEVHPRRDTLAVSVREPFDTVAGLIIHQNYVPIVDDNGIFIGIVTRKSVLKEII